MNWNNITSDDNIIEAINISETKPVLIFKYSTRCSISHRVFDLFEMQWAADETGNEEKIAPFFIDLIKYRSLSNEIAKKFNVIHESPQVLVIKNGKCVYAESHGYISLNEVLKFAESHK